MNNLLLPKLGNGVPMPQPQVQIAQPLNDMQLVALMACHLVGDAAERVKLAVEILAETITAMNGNALGKALQRRES